MNPIPLCFQKISPGNHFRTYGTDVHTYVRTYVRSRVMLYAPPPIINGGGIKSRDSATFSRKSWEKKEHNKK